MQDDLQQFMARVQGDLKKFLEEEQDEPIRVDRLAQISRAKKASLYWDGKQYLRPSFDQEQLTVDWVPIPDQYGQAKVFNRVDNVILGDGTKFCSLIAQHKMNHRCVPDDPDNPESVKQARNAFTMGKYLQRYWNLQERVFDEIAQQNWITGAVYGLVDYETNGTKHGQHEEPNIVPEEVALPGNLVCDNCGEGDNPETATVCQSCQAPLDPKNVVPGVTVTVPKQDGVNRYERGMAELKLLNCLYVTTPFLAKSLEEAGWLDYSQVGTKSWAKAQARRLGYKGDVNANESDDTPIRAKEAQEQIASPVVDWQNERNEFVYSQRWLRASEYELMKRSLREEFQERFPKGVRLHRIGGTLIHAEESRIEDHWRVCKSGYNAFINGPGLCETTMNFQDYWNDFWNMASERILRGVPKTIIDSQIIDGQYLRENPDAQIGELLFTHTAGIDMNKAIGTIPTATFPAELPAVAQAMRQGSREVNGVQQALYGADEGSQTWREANQKKGQAMAQFQPSLDRTQTFGAGIKEIGVKLSAKNGFGKVLLTPDNSTGFETVEEIDLQDLSEEGYHFEPEEVVAQTVGELKQNMAGLAQEAPMIFQATGALSPLNAGRLQTLFGDPTMITPGQYDRDRIMERIYQLLQQQPIMGMDPMTGAPIEQPSIMPDEFEDSDHMGIADLIRTWCVAPRGRKTQKENPVGYRNVVLHGQAQVQMGQAMMAPPPPPGAPPQAQQQPPPQQ